MSPAPPRKLRHDTWSQYLPDMKLGFQNLLLHKLRTLLTMLGMIIGVILFDGSATDTVQR